MDQNQPPYEQHLYQHAGYPPQSYAYNQPPRHWIPSEPSTPTDPSFNFHSHPSASFSSQQGSWDLPPTTPMSFMHYSQHSTPALYQTPFRNTTSTVNNTTAATSRGEKRGADVLPLSAPPRKKRRARVPPPSTISTANTCGVGPSQFETEPINSSLADSLPVTVPPTQRYKSYTGPKATSANSATDVWYFMRVLKERPKPEQWPLKDTEGNNIEEPVMLARPSGPDANFIGCKLCTA